MNRLRLSEGEGESGEAEEAEISSVRFASAAYVCEERTQSRQSFFRVASSMINGESAHCSCRFAF